MDKELIDQSKAILLSLNSKADIPSSLSSLKSILLSKPKPSLGDINTETSQELYSLFFNSLSSCFRESEDLCNLSLEVHNE